jgi:hypothetical protein
MKFEPGDYVIAVMQNPREKIFGILEEVSAAGITIRGIDLEYFEDWSRAVASGEPHLPMNEQFVPMWRVERMMRDQRNGEVPSLAEQFEARTNISLSDV